MILVEENKKVKGTFKGLVLSPSEDTTIAAHSMASITINVMVKPLTARDDLIFEVQLDYPLAAAGLILAGKSIGEESITLAIANITKKPITVSKENPVILVTFGTRVELKAVNTNTLPKGLKLNLDR